MMPPLVVLPTTLNWALICCNGNSLPSKIRPRSNPLKHHSFSPRTSHRLISLQLGATNRAAPVIDWQSDERHYGRGEQHLSAALQERDVVMYQAGSWYIDGVLVGDYDASPSFHWCSIETLQVVWTHNCEHGVIRGFPLRQPPSLSANYFTMESEPEMIEFGPEQLVARIPVEWLDDTTCRALVDLQTIDMCKATMNNAI